MSICSKFSQLYFCQILFELAYSWESYHKNKKGELFLLRHIVVQIRQTSQYEISRMHQSQKGYFHLINHPVGRKA